jgi:hypothetical protein
MNTQNQWLAQMIFLRPTDNEFFRIMIQILFVKGRRVVLLAMP